MKPQLSKEKKRKINVLFKIAIIILLLAAIGLIIYIFIPSEQFSDQELCISSDGRVIENCVCPDDDMELDEDFGCVYVETNPLFYLIPGIFILVFLIFIIKLITEGKLTFLESLEFIIFGYTLGSKNKEQLTNIDIWILIILLFLFVISIGFLYI